MKVKICGIKDIKTALSAIESGADALGFVFARSKRRIVPEEAGEIRRIY
jgi:phosphoribosylanthranilate isomerase